MNTIGVILFIYVAGVAISFILIYLISQEKCGYRILGSVLTGLTWPLSLIPALLFSLL